MTVSIRRLSLGAGYAYLMNSVARADVAAPGSSSLTRYYAETGTPPGYWLGDGLAGLADGTGLKAGSEVGEEQLWRLLGMLADPVTGQALGNAPRRSPGSLAGRISARVAALNTRLTTADRVAAVAAIESEERAREARVTRPVAAFDMTFSVPKSVSTVWALADAPTQEAIHAAHLDAIEIAMRWAQEQIVFTRTGRNGAFQEPVRGVVAAAFDHWDSRAGDPHLHTHVVIANRVQTLDGRWRTLDSKTLHRYTVALSELHEGVLQDLLTDRLGYAWTTHSRRHSTVPRYDIDAVPAELMAEFSQRSSQIQSDMDDLVTTFAATHGRHPSEPELLRLRQRATIATRPHKQHHSLADLCSEWRDRANDTTGSDSAAWAATIGHRAHESVLIAGSFESDRTAEIAAQVLDAVSTKRATFTHANVFAQAHRRLHGTRFLSPKDRLATADRITSRALSDALRLNPADPARPDLRLHKGAEIYSTRRIFDAETRLLDAGRDITAPALPQDTPSTLPKQGDVVLGDDQAAAVAEVATSGRRLDLLIGPAGTGKTTSLRALRAAWERHNGSGSVVGLAPSAVAAEVLGDQLGIATENTAKWLTEHARTADRDAHIALVQAHIDECSSLGSHRARRLIRKRNAEQAERDRWVLRPGQLLIIDEASLAGTLSLDQVTSHADTADAKVLLVGDPMQLGPIDAGGAFAMLANDRDNIAELTEPRRFAEAWEQDATLQLRAGNPDVIGVYEAHDRIRSGDHDEVLNQVLRRWADDRAVCLESLMIAADGATVTELNLRARAQRIRSGEIPSDGVATADGAAGIGDQIITRRNDRTLRVGFRNSQWVRNGDSWTVAAVGQDGSITARNAAGSLVQLDTDYVRAHVELGYATTAYLAQGRTVDTAHVIVNQSSSREALYVGATRGRRTNTLNVITDEDLDPSTDHEPDAPRDSAYVLAASLGRSSVDTSAHASVPAPSAFAGGIIESCANDRSNRPRHPAARAVSPPI